MNMKYFFLFLLVFFFQILFITLLSFSWGALHHDIGCMSVFVCAKKKKKNKCLEKRKIRYQILVVFFFFWFYTLAKDCSSWKLSAPWTPEEIGALILFFPPFCFDSVALLSTCCLWRWENYVMKWASCYGRAVFLFFIFFLHTFPAFYCKHHAVHIKNNQTKACYIFLSVT